MSENKYCYKYPRPAVTTDAVVFLLEKNRLYVLLIQRGNEPFKGKWAFPGGFVNMDETTDVAAIRELSEETGLTNVQVFQFHTFSDPDRDPRHRTISVAYLGLINKKVNVKGGDDAAHARWFPLDELPELAFDHDKVITVAQHTLLDKIEYRPLQFEQFGPEEIRKVKNLLMTANKNY